MGLFDQFPYTNFHELNLDWIVEQMRSQKDYVDKIDDHVAEVDKHVTEVDKHVTEVNNNVLNVDKHIDAKVAEITPPLVKSTVEQMSEDGKLLANSVFNVVLHGADNTGVTDASSAIQYTIDKYHFAYIPNGLYKVDKTLIIDSGCVLIGQSCIDTILNVSAINGIVTKDFFSKTATGTEAGIYGFTIANLHLTGLNTENAGYGIAVYGYRYRITNCFIEKFHTGLYSEYNKSTGFAPSGSTMESLISHCLIQRNISTAMVFRGPSDSRIEDVDFSNSPYGIVFETTDSSWAYGTKAINCHGYRITAVGCYTVKDNISLINCIGESSYNGVDIAGSGIVLANCSFYNNDTSGIYFSTGRDISIFDATLQGNKGSEIHLQSQLSDSYITARIVGTPSAVLSGGGGVDIRTTSIKVYSNVDASIYNSPKSLPITGVGDVTANTAHKASDNYCVLAYQTGGEGFSVNDGTGDKPIGNAPCFFVPAGGTWKCTTEPGSMYYQPILF
jgi:hypothetical protein|nr:MAG TPA: Pectate lyase [Caudoviricetes sp.]